jgi:hypothetical protein
MENPRIVRYDGSSDIRNDDPQSFFDLESIDNDNEDGMFDCDRCGGQFYGDYDFISDDEECWCRACANEYAHLCWNGQYYHDMDSFPNRPAPRPTLVRNIYEEDTPSRSRAIRMGYPIYEGEGSDRFLAHPTVGIEFEHAPVQERAQNTSNDGLFLTIARGKYSPSIPWSNLFKIHGDGSIANMDNHGSAEIVSMPASGVILEAVINRFYEPFANGTFTPGPEHHTCGFHMHVESRLLEYMDKTGDSMSINNEYKTASRNLLQNMINICDEFVSSTRRKSKFCVSKAGMRDKGTGTVGASLMGAIFGMGSYPAIAVRSIATLEYRLWPSSNSIKNTVARAELSQKLTKLFDEALFDGTSNRIDKDKVELIANIASMCVGGTRIGIPAKLQEILGLSSATTESLEKLSARFNPYSGKKTHFHFSEYQIRCIKNEKSEDAADFVMPPEGGVNHVGDTTAYVGKLGGLGNYLTFGECIKCYPASTEGEMPRLVAALAKGEQ